MLDLATQRPPDLFPGAQPFRTSHNELAIVGGSHHKFLMDLISSPMWDGKGGLVSLSPAMSLCLSTPVSPFVFLCSSKDYPVNLPLTLLGLCFPGAPSAYPRAPLQAPIQ
ncbi:unnamed protein product [Leuciscus chuanchicus]